MAQQTRPDLHAEIELRFPDNTTEDITPLVVREFLHELVDSAQLPASDKLAFGQALTLAQAQAILSGTLGAPELTTGWLYLVGGAWNAGAAGQVVAVTAIGPRAFASFGTLVNGATVKGVEVDVAAGTTTRLGVPDLSAIVAVLDQHTLQLATLGVQAAPVMVYLEGGDVEGYATLDEALADSRPKTFMRFNVATVRVTQSNDPLSPNWASFVDGVGATIELGANVVLSLPGGTRGALQFKNFFIYQAAGTRGGRVELLVTGNNSTPPGQLPILDGECSVPLRLNGGAVALSGVYGSLQGSGDAHTFGLCELGSTAAGITVVPPFVGGGGSYSDEDAQDAAAAQLLAAQQRGVRVSQDTNTKQLTIENTVLVYGRLYFNTAKSGTGNLVRSNFAITPAEEAVYAWAGDSNVDRVELKSAGSLFAGTLAQFKALNFSFLSGQDYYVVLTPLDVNAPAFLDLRRA